MGAGSRGPGPDSPPLSGLIVDLLRPYRGWLAVVLAAMLVEIAMSLAAPWPLKLVLDDALVNRHLPEWLAWAHGLGFGQHTLGVAAFAGVATVLIAAVGAVAAYVDNYYTASIGQWVANDLRLRIYEHMQRLSLAYYDTAKSGALMSTITTFTPLLNLRSALSAFSAAPKNSGPRMAYTWICAGRSCSAS